MKEELRELAGLVRVMRRVMEDYTRMARDSGHLPAAQKACARVEEALLGAMRKATEDLEDTQKKGGGSNADVCAPSEKETDRVKPSCEDAREKSVTIDRQHAGAGTPALVSYQQREALAPSAAPAP